LYNINYTKESLDDIQNILEYITNVLLNKTAAKKLRNDFINAIETLKIFPYGISIHYFENELDNAYRCLNVNNYVVIYTIDEEEKCIIINRILYNKMNFNNIFK